jgi:ABC-type Fe3+ transport system substrate-binding protein
MTLRLRHTPLAAAAAFAALIFVLAPPAPARALEMNPALKKIVDAAKTEGSLTLEYGEAVMGGSEGARVAKAGIKKMFGVDLTVNFTPGPSFAPMASRIYTEKQAGQKASTDVYYGTAVQITPYLSRGLFRKIPWTTLYPGRITPEIAEADGAALRVTTGTPGVLYNIEKAPEFAKVRTMADLLKPEYKGKLYTQPYLAGFDVLVADDMWGFDKTADYVRKLSKQIGGLLRCGSGDRIASGEIPGFAIDCTGSDENLEKYHNIIGIEVMRDAAMRRYDYLCIPENAAHPNAGILLALFASSPEGQKEIQDDLFGNDLDSYPDTKTHARVAALEKEGVKFRDVTVAWWSHEKGIQAHLKQLIKIIAER